MRQSSPPCQPVRDANLSCRYEGFITTVVILPITCLCDCCDGKVPRRMCWLPPDCAKPVSASHENREPWRVLGCDMAEWYHPMSDTRKVNLWMCVDEATKCTVGHVWAEDQQVGHIDGSLAGSIYISLWTDAHTATRKCSKG